MSDWQPVTQPPSEVGLYEYQSKGFVFYARWDGRHFRGQLSFNVLMPKEGDVWRLPDRKDSGDVGQ